MSDRQFFRHYKSQDQDSIAGCYEVLGTVVDHETDQVGRIYRPCYCSMNHGDMGYYRPAPEFNELVPNIPRFTRITDPALIKRLVAATDLLYGK